MPKILTLNAKSILAGGYKKGEENRRRYDEEMEEAKKNDKFQRNLSVYNSALNAYNASKKSKGYKGVTDDSGNIYDSEATRKAYENPSDSSNEVSYKKKIYDGKRDYKIDSSKYRVK